MKCYGLPKQSMSLQILKGCVQQILLGPFLNTLTHMTFKWTPGVKVLSANVSVNVSEVMLLFFFVN